MGSFYLDIAEAVLRRARVPLSPREILAYAYVEEAVPSHLQGKTQDKTMQARLSEDIARLRDKSIFFRTNRARFFLRYLCNDPKIPPLYKVEYFARPRRKDLKNERVLVFEKLSLSPKAEQHLSSKDLDNIFKHQSYRYAHWTEASSQSDLVPVYSFVVFHNGSEILTHVTGQFNEYNHPSKGFRSIGLGSAVRIQDGDLLYNAYHGIIGSAINELTYRIGLPRELAREARYGSKVCLHFALAFLERTKASHIVAIMTYRCPADYEISKVSLSLNRLAWMRLNKESPLDGFDRTSRILLNSDKFLALLART